MLKVPKKNKKSGGKHESGKPNVEKFFIPKTADIEVPTCFAIKIFSCPRKSIQFIFSKLESVKVVAQDIRYLRYFNDYQWFVDFSMYAGIVYTLTEVILMNYSKYLSFRCWNIYYSLYFTWQIYSYFFSIQNEINLSMLWCLIVQGFALYPFDFIVF